MSIKLTKKERDVARVMQDPVLWVSEHIDEPRWYQELVLRHPHHRILLRMGRRLGKCIAAGQRVLDPVSGRYLTVEELYTRNLQNARLYTLDGEQLKESNAFHIEDNGVKPTFEVTTLDGAKVELTGNHPVLTKRGWVEVDDLKYDDHIAVPASLNYKGTIHVQTGEIVDWVMNHNTLPEDIHEWEWENLEKFLRAYAGKYGKNYDGAHLDYSRIPLQTLEDAREFKHLLLRIGYTSVISCASPRQIEMTGDEYVLIVQERKKVDYYFTPLKGVKPIGEQQTYDLSVPKTHNLVVEDMIVHNTWTMSAHMLWVAMTNWGGRLASRKKGLDILVATPYDTQAKEIYEQLLEMIEHNPALKNSMESAKQGPPREINFYNGSTIKLFTAGTSSSNNAASVRGQRADK